MEEYENMARNNMEEYENQARNRAIIRWAGQRFDAATFRRIINIGRRAGPRAGDQDIQEEYDPTNPGYDPVDLNNGFFPLYDLARNDSVNIDAEKTPDISFEYSDEETKESTFGDDRADATIELDSTNDTNNTIEVSDSDDAGSSLDSSGWENSEQDQDDHNVAMYDANTGYDTDSSWHTAIEPPSERDYRMETIKEAEELERSDCP